MGWISKINSLFKATGLSQTGASLFTFFSVVILFFAILYAVLQILYSVSYTHLDVYKRQSSSCFIWVLSGGCDRFSFLAAPEMVPSFTTVTKCESCFNSMNLPLL